MSTTIHLFVALRGASVRTIPEDIRGSMEATLRGDGWRTADVTLTSNAGRPSARVTEYAGLPNRVAGGYSHPRVSAHDADALWRQDHVEYPVSGDQSLREHGRGGMRQATGPEIVRRHRGHIDRRVIVVGTLHHDTLTTTEAIGLDQPEE